MSVIHSFGSSGPVFPDGRANPRLFSVNEAAKQTLPLPAIRRATGADVLAMAKVHIESWRETYPGMLPEPMLSRLSIADEAIRWQRVLDHPLDWGDAVAFVADRQGTIVGYGLCGEQRIGALRRHGFTAEISEIYVLRSAQGQGAGSALMKAMAGVLLDNGHDAMSLWVIEQNHAARRFYESLGGVPIAEKRLGLREMGYGWRPLAAFFDLQRQP